MRAIGRPSGHLTLGWSIGEMSHARCQKDGDRASRAS
jgi:hypothetical protein